MDVSPQHSSNTPNPSPIVQTTNTRNPNANDRQNPRPNPARAIPTRFPSVGHRAFRGSGSGPVGFDQPKKKRGRPRKYGPPNAAPQNLSGNAMLVLNQGSRAAGGRSRVRGNALAGVVRADGGGSGVASHAFGGAAGIDFTPHLLMIKPGEDIFLELMAFLQGRRTLCILSATGCIGKARIKPSPSSEYTVYEGCYEILSLRGSFTLSESDRTGYMKVIMSGPAGRVIGGAVSGMLVAASPVQIVVGSFPVPGPVMLNFSGPPSPAPSVGSSNENAGTPK